MINTKTKRIISIALAATLALSLTACSGSGTNNPTTTETSDIASASVPAQEQTSASFSEPAETIASETTVSETETTEPAETPVPSLDEAGLLIFENLNNAKSVVIDCNLKGKLYTKTGDAMVNQSFTYSVADNMTHLMSSFEDLNTNDPAVKYEEYQQLKDNIITTYVKKQGAWDNSLPKDMIRCSMMANVLSTMPLINLFATNADHVTTILNNPSLERTETNDYIITQTGIENLQGNVDYIAMNEHPFAGLIRTPAIEDSLYDLTYTYVNNCNIIYTFDNNFNLKTIVFDIIVKEQTPCDLHCELNFSKWNAVSPIIPPTVAAASIETTEDSAETDLTVVEKTIAQNNTPTN